MDSQQQRPLGLTLFESMLVIAILAGLIQSVTGRREFVAYFPKLTPGLYMAMQCCAAATVVGAIGVFQFRLWGISVQIISLILSFALEAWALDWNPIIYRIPLGLMLLLLVIWPFRARFR